jgi:hypothetical protein
VVFCSKAANIHPLSWDMTLFQIVSFSDCAFSDCCCNMADMPA